jgi:hypothetical protein
MSAPAYGKGILTGKAVDDGEMWISAARAVDLIWRAELYRWVA